MHNKPSPVIQQKIESPDQQRTDIQQQLEAEETCSSLTLALCKVDENDVRKILKVNFAEMYILDRDDLKETPCSLIDRGALDQPRMD